MSELTALLASEAASERPIVVVPDQYASAAGDLVQLKLSLYRLGTRKAVSYERHRDVLKDEVQQRRCIKSVSIDILESGCLKAIASLDVRIRNRLKTYSQSRIPTGMGLGSGVHVFSINNVRRIDDDLRRLQLQRDRLVDNFCDEYADVIWSAWCRLQPVGLFDPTHYPGLQLVDPDAPDGLRVKLFPNANLRAYFLMTWMWLAISTPPVLEQLDKELFDAQRRRLESWAQDVKYQSEAGLALALNDVITNLTASLSGGEKRIKGDALSPLMEFFDTFNKVALRQDGALSDVIKQAKAILREGGAGGTPQTLEMVAKRIATEVAPGLGKIVEDVPKRQFSFTDDEE